MMRRILAGLCGLVLSLAAVDTVPAQCTGNGANGRLSHGLMAVGTALELRIEGGATQTFGVWASSGLTSIYLPNLGFVCVDPAAPVFLQLLQGQLPLNGTFQLFYSVPNDPFWVQTAFWTQGLVTDPTTPGGLALTRALRMDYEVPDTHVATTNLLFSRDWPRADSLEQNGLVLVTGGSSGSDWFSGIPFRTTEFYDPVQRAYYPGPQMAVPRVHHTQTRLADGRLLVAGGGATQNGTATNSCEIFDPATLAFQPAASMGSPRLGHEAVRLDDGRVLVMGGTTSLLVDSGTPGFYPAYASILPTAELYDPATNAWTPVPGNMAVGRVRFRALRLPNGRVLVVSGISGASGMGNTPSVIEGSPSCEVFDPVLGAFLTAAPLPVGPCADFAATRLLSGRVVVSGGIPLSPPGGSPTSAPPLQAFSAYDYGINTWSILTGAVLPTGVRNHSQVLLDDGDLLVIGGFTGTGSSGTSVVATLLLDAATMTTGAVASLPTGLASHATVRLSDGAILNLGGRGGSLFGPALAIGTSLLYTPTY